MAYLLRWSPVCLSNRLPVLTAAGPADHHPDDPSGQTVRQLRRNIHRHEGLLKENLHP